MDHLPDSSFLVNSCVRCLVITTTTATSPSLNLGEMNGSWRIPQIPYYKGKDERNDKKVLKVLVMMMFIGVRVKSD